MDSNKPNVLALSRLKKGSMVIFQSSNNDALIQSVVKSLVWTEKGSGGGGGGGGGEIELLLKGLIG